MKNYDEIANIIFERRDKYIAKQKRKKRIIIGTVTSVLCCCIVLITSFGLWENGYFSNNITISGNSQNVSDKSDNDSSADNKNSSTNSSNSSKDSTPSKNNNSQGGVASDDSTPSDSDEDLFSNPSYNSTPSDPDEELPSKPSNDSNFSSEDEFIYDNSTPSDFYEDDSSEPSDDTPSNVIPSDPPVIENDYFINSIDKINFYSAKKIISEDSLLPIGMNYKSNFMPNIISLSNIYVEYPIDRNKVFTITMVTYFTIQLSDEKGFLAQKLGGTGLVEVVVTQNNIDDLGQMITFKREEKYYTCFANGGDYDTDLNNSSSEFSSHKYIDGFNIVKNFEQENYKFTVHYDGSKVIGFECAPFHSVPTNYTVDDITFIEDFCIVLYTKQTFTIDELEVYFKNEKEGETL